MKLEPKTVVSDRYEILELIGVGGMANVYCAKDLKLDRKVSFKVLKEEFIDEEFIGKFSKEARAAARISHINIANVYDVGNDGNIYYIVMEYVDGYTLKDIIKTKAPFTNEEVLGISIQIANALEVAHSNNIVHRDIKPQNILVTKDGGIKVTDFGIARATTSNTITTDTMGSVHYFSPEQARGGYVDFKSDIYSLGIIMFEMITGKLPFDGDGVVQLAMKHINEPLPDMKELNPKISSSLEKIILKATNKNSDNRYSSTKELNLDLKKALSDESGKFVTENSIDEDSPTIVIKPEEIEQIKNMSKNIDNKVKEDKAVDKINQPAKNMEKAPKQSTKNISMPKINKEDDKSLDKKVTIWAIITSLLIIGVISGFLIVWLLSDGNSKVPDFKGKTWEEAVEIAKNKEIYITNTKEEYDPNIKEGAIIDQDIKAGQKVKKGSNINVTLSLGSGRFEVENFVGLDISEVYKKVENLSVELKEEYIYDNNIPIGKVVKQRPEGGTSLNPGDNLTLYISKGKEEDETSVAVPYLIGLSESEAKSKIKKEGLSVGKVSKVENDTVPEGNVIEQSISYGKEVPEGTAISIVISKGKKQTTESTTQAIVQDTSTEITTQAMSEYKETTTYQPVLKSENLVINPTLPEGVENVEVKVVKIVDGQSITIWSSNHNVSSFPLSITVTGDKPAQFELYIDGKLIGTEIKNFN
ncbi:Stk1 family PASTA domain-containing Ser/Thr kinase [[Clostridium] colinum]|uniref:Stk1 family PASTA domain-containing Ser/Thr kinase n=1 Tax=[Clostridium] colinum TaxID=36835 RepID=UPI0020245959|nr:Stk1 family PASTA domain-containing Ser/Thr kinase [[Clostridium] colinum]